MIHFEDIFGKKIGKARVIPITLKIIIIFTIIILASNLSSNYINLVFNQNELILLMKRLLAKDLKEINTYSNTQYEIYKHNQDRESALGGIEKKARYELRERKAVTLGVAPDGHLLFQVLPSGKRTKTFADRNSLEFMNKNRKEGFLSIHFEGKDYFAVYKYNPSWDAFIIQGQEKSEFYARQRIIFRNISIIIIVITLAAAAVGIYLLSYLLRYIHIITSNIMAMVENQRLEIIDLKKAPNDDITYLGMAFNSLSSTIDNLVGIFRKFTNKDVVIKAYRDRQVRLEGVQKELTILFSDIKSFTLITETLGTDIIRLLNMHYDRAIREIQDQDGIVSSIIGDAILGVYGVMDDTEEGGMLVNKSYRAVYSAYKIQETARSLRHEMREKKEQLIRMNGSLTPAEERTYKAVLLEVGVGIDGGDVFYGTIGSSVRMTNTVIGDNVNSASRLEGLTRLYRVPVICSQFIKDDIENNLEEHGLTFLELDRVQVKGKTEGRRIYFPIHERHMSDKLREEIESFEKGRELYYEGNWPEALTYFSRCKLKFAKVFVERTKSNTPPLDWNGIWEMTTK